MDRISREAAAARSGLQCPKYGENPPRRDSHPIWGNPPRPHRRRTALNWAGRGFAPDWMTNQHAYPESRHNAKDSVTTDTRPPWSLPSNWPPRSPRLECASRIRSRADGPGRGIGRGPCVGPLEPPGLHSRCRQGNLRPDVLDVNRPAEQRITNPCVLTPLVGARFACATTDLTVSKPQ